MSDPSSDDRFVDLLTRHQGQIFGYIFAAVQNLSDAEELYQDTSLVLWRKFSHYQPGSDFARWACKTAKYEILHFFRNRRRSPVCCFNEKILTNLADIQDFRTDDAHQDHQNLLAACVEELQPVDRRLVELCYGGQRTIKQYAEELQRSVQTLYNSLSRIRRLLFDCVHRKLEGEEER